MVRHYLYIKVAPSRYAPRPSDDLAVDRAQRFVERAFLGVFPREPDTAGPDQVGFAVWDEQRSTHRHAVYVHRSGLVEVLWEMVLEPGARPGEHALDAVELVRPILSLAEGVASDEYAQLSRAGRGRRRFARVDWLLSTTSYASGQDGQIGWDAVAFPASSPPRAANQRPVTPPGGYGQRTLRSSRRRRKPDDIAAAFMRELLLENGYHSLGDAVDEVVAAAKRARTMRRDDTQAGPPTGANRVGGAAQT